MSKHYEKIFRTKIARLRLEEDKSIESIAKEFRISKESLRRWCMEYQQECPNISLSNGSGHNVSDFMKENLRLRTELAEKEKQVLFLKKKKNGGILCEGNRLETYRFIEQYRSIFGVRCLLKQMGFFPNAYYSYFKHRKAKNRESKQKILDMIQGLFHRYNGVLGYRQMRIHIEGEGIFLSYPTVHKYYEQRTRACRHSSKEKENFLSQWKT